MKPGNLVRIKRGGIATPAGSLGLLLSSTAMVGASGKIWSVSVILPNLKGRTRPPLRYLEGDLEVVSE